MDYNASREDFRSSYDYSYEGGVPTDDEEGDEDFSSRPHVSSHSRQSVIFPAKRRRMDDFSSTQTHQNGQSSTRKHSTQFESCLGHSRTIVHVDIDCFYAQVEMIRRPELREVPLGIQQKHIVVTCNYVARERGVKKLVYISDAKKTCPDLVLVNGEDLTNYREFSGRVHSLLSERFTPLVERLGMDENFLDVTELVKSRELALPSGRMEYVGGLYASRIENCKDKDITACPCGCHERLRIGSLIAAEIRQVILQEIGLTCCAGIAHNKLLAKLVGAWKKPNKQTTLLPEDAGSLLSGLKAKDIPGIGHSTAKKLQTINISSVTDLLSCPSQVLEKEFGHSLADLMIKLCNGIDESKVTPSREFKTITDEDSFKCCSTLEDATKRLRGLVKGILPRISSSTTVLPQTVRVSIRRRGEKSHKRESRQSALPQAICFADEEKAGDLLFEVCVSLFKKVVDVSKPFHLSLLGISLTNFYKPSSGQPKEISNFFQKSCSKHANLTSVTSCSSLESKGNYLFEREDWEALPKSCEDKLSDQRTSKVGTTNTKDWKQVRSSKLTTQHTQPKGISIDGATKDVSQPAIICPSGIDPAVFAELPLELQKELQAQWPQSAQETANTKRVTVKEKKSAGIQRYFTREGVNNDSGTPK